ncbi:MAG: CBS domain-containing protein [Pseudomonadota bacterium]
MALSFRLGAGYDSFMIEQYIDALLRIDPRLTVVFISTDGDFQASSDGANVRAIIANDHFENELKQAITSSDLIALKELIAVSTRAIAPETTNAEALRIMLDDKVRSLVAVDAIGRPAGVVRRDDIMARMLTKLAG